MIVRTPGRRLAAALESGALARVLPSALSLPWARFARAERPLPVASRARVVGVGGALLGGSGKTPLSQALALALGQRGLRVALACSTHPIRRRNATRTLPDARVDEVGDEALMLARTLTPAEVPVFASSPRAHAVAEATTVADVVVADGLLQARPRLTASLLAVDAYAPWGSGYFPPLGDLRLTRKRALAACDAVVRIGVPAQRDVDQYGGKPVFDVGLTLHGARLADGTLVDVEQLRRLRVGVALGLARPERVLRLLAQHGIHPERVRLAADHRVALPDDRPGVDLWLVTAKCAVKLEGRGRGPDPARLEVAWQLDDPLISFVFSKCRGSVTECVSGREESFDHVVESRACLPSERLPAV